jgi:hypothetical protein
LHCNRHAVDAPYLCGDHPRLASQVIRKLAEVVDDVYVQVSDWLVHRTSPNCLPMLATSSTWFGKITFASSQVVVVTRVLPSFQAFERDNNAIGLQQDLSRFHGGPWLA